MNQSVALEIKGCPPFSPLNRLPRLSLLLRPLLPTRNPGQRQTQHEDADEKCPQTELTPTASAFWRRGGHGLPDPKPQGATKYRYSDLHILHQSRERLQDAMNRLWLDGTTGPRPLSIWWFGETRFSRTRAEVLSANTCPSRHSKKAVALALCASDIEERREAAFQAGRLRELCL